MDFNEIQKTWSEDKNENVQLPTNLNKIQSANMPLEKIKKNLKGEFLTQVSAIFIIGFLPIIQGYPEIMFSPFYLLYGIAVAVTAYYFLKFYYFYKRICSVSLNTKDNLYETYFDIRLNMELYKTFNIAFSVFGIIGLVGFILYRLSKKTETISSILDSSTLVMLLIIIGVTVLLIGLILEWWVNHFYGKYAKEVKKIIDELKE